MGLNDFVISKERSLPIFILADTSGSMKGEKILMLNSAIQEMVATLGRFEDIRGKFKISIISFGSNVIVHQLPTEVSKLEITELEAIGKTFMGEAFKKIASIIEDKEIIVSQDYSPTIILVSDGQPTDYPDGLDRSLESYMKWEPLSQLHNSPRLAKCLRIALGVGTDADVNMLNAFLNNGTSIMPAKNAADISKFFKWITMSSISRISSSNPNDIQSFLNFNVDEAEEWIL